jgi:hypothetical protein
MNEITNKGEGRGPSPVVPKKLSRITRKLSAAGEELVLIAPAILHSQASEQMLAIARMGMLDKILGYLVTTDKNVHFVRPGIAWDSVRTVPLDVITGVEYVDEFHTNTLKLLVGERAEKIIFYEDLEGIRFYKYIRGLKRQDQTAEV